MSSIPAPGYADGFHVVVAEDGSLPARELARLGLRPGAHLRLIPEQRPAARRRTTGALATTVPTEAVDALIRGLDEAKAERIASYRDATDQA
ncbi:MAG: hypothetical protein H0U62_09980 [Actinobacteria bacterium]|nr:hypothetical protein [Actinomycetota bacterium]